MEKEYYPISSTESKLQVQLDIDPQKHYSHVCVSSIEIPKTYYALPEDANITILENGVETTITVEKGNYNIRSLANELKNNLNTNCTYTYDITFSDVFIEKDTSKYTFTVSDNIDQPTLTITDYYLKRLLGLTETSQFAANQLISTNVLNFQSHNALYLKSNIVSNRSKLIQEIYTAGNPYNTSVLWMCPDLELYAKNINRVPTDIYEFNLLDRDGDIVDLNGSEWSAVICVMKFDNTNAMIKNYIMYKVNEQDTISATFS